MVSIDEDVKRKLKLGCGCFICIWILIIVITLLACIRGLGPEDQIVEYGNPFGKKVINGPQTTLVHPFRKREERKATRLSKLQYAVVKNVRSGLVRHEHGPNLLFLGPWDEQLRVEKKSTLQQKEYMRLVDELTGYERIEKGPQIFVPNPLENSPKGKELGIVISAGKSVVTIDKTKGIRILRTAEGLFIPEPYEHVLEERFATVIGPKSYAAVKNITSGQIRHVPGALQLKIGPYDLLLGTYDKIVLQKDQFCRFVDQLTGNERIVAGPQTFVPTPSEKSKTDQVIQKAHIVGTDNALLVYDAVTGKERLETTPGVFFPQAYEEVKEDRTAHIIRPEKYAIVKNLKTGISQNVPGPTQLKIQQYEELTGEKTKVVLQKDEYMRLIDNFDGTEKVERGAATIVPLPEEIAPDGPQKAIFIDADTALVVLSRDTGMRRLVDRSKIVDSEGGYTLKPYEKIIAQRKRITVLPHEAVIIRDWQGQLSVRSGAPPAPGQPAQSAAFFLDPYDELVSMNWSNYAMEFRDGVNVPKIQVEKVELRQRKMFFKYQVRTSDNVQLTIEGSVFWVVVDVGKMIKATADPEGDVWQHARSAMIQAVGKAKLAEFMVSFTQLTKKAFDEQASDFFYTFRGIKTETVQVTKYDCVDPVTADILQQIIEVTTERLKAVEKQEYSNTAALLKIKADIELEDQLTQLIETQKANTLLQAKAEGEAVGYKELKEVVGFLDGLNESVTDVTERVNLFKIQEKLKGRSQDIANLNQGKMNLFYAPSTMAIRMDMAGNSNYNSNTDRRLAGQAHHSE